MSTPHVLTEYEVIQGMILTSMQKQVLENRIAELSEQIVAAPASRDNANDYFDKLNFQKGQIWEIKEMLRSSELAEQTTNTAQE